MKWPASISGEAMLANGNAIGGDIVVNNHHNCVNSQPRITQDDARVGYSFQRPHSDPDFSPYTAVKHTRWAIGDDSNVEERAEGDIEGNFQALALEGHTHNGTSEMEIAPVAKKLWSVGVEDGHKQEDKGIFLGGPRDQWRDAPWSTGTASDHAVSQPIMVQGSRQPGAPYPGANDVNSVLSPRSSETGGLGVKMVEYVLGSSPTSKDLDTRMARLGLGADSDEVKARKEPAFDGTGATVKKLVMKGVEENGSTGVVGVQTNGICPVPIANGLSVSPDDVDKNGIFNRTPGSRQPSPSDEDMNKKAMDDLQALQNAGVLMNHPHLAQQQHMQHLAAIQSSHGQQQHHHHQAHHHHQQHVQGQFEQQMNNGQATASEQGLDPLQFEYSSQLQMPSSLESPTVNDYNNSHMYQQRGAGDPQQHPSGIHPYIAHHNYAMAAAAAAHHQGAPYPPYMYGHAQDPYNPQMGPMMIPAPYYNMAPWPQPMYPPGMIPHQQNGNGSMPPGSSSGQGQQQLRGSRPLTPQPESNGFSMMAPYYDPLLGGNRSMPPTMRLISPAQMIPSHNGGMVAANNLRMQLGSANTPPQSIYSSGGPMGQQHNSLYSHSPMNNFQPNSSPMGSYSSQNGGFGSNTLGALGSASLGLCLNGTMPRRDSLERRPQADSGLTNGLYAQSSAFSDYRQPSGLPTNGMGKPNTQYFGAIGTVTASPGPLGAMLPSSGHLPTSLTPPPLGSSQLGLGGFMSGSRIVSAAPGAEARSRASFAANGVFGSSSSLFPNRSLQRTSSLDKAAASRSRLLEDFRNNRYPNLTLGDLANHIVEFSQDQHGSRFIQQKLERATPVEKQMVFTEILSAAYSLMTDVFGNYVIQKFFEFGTSEQKQALAAKVRGHVLPLALQMYGCRVIQKALESIPADQQKDVVKELDGHILKCVKDQNGNHVVQKCIESVEPVALQFIINAFHNQVYSLSAHPYGCRVIQRILEHCTIEQTTPILDELHQNTEQLIQDQYGNYVIQHVLEHGRTENKSKIVAVVRGKVLSLSQHKFASNVVEKCISHATRAERAILIEEVCSYSDGPNSALQTMMKDQFANYVVQKMIDVAEPAQRKILMHKIRPHVNTLRKYTYGKHILAKLEKYFLKNNDVLGPIGSHSPTGNCSN